MNDQQRLHRDDPERTDPIRHWSKLYRQDDSWGSQASSANASPRHTPPPNETTDDAISQGVKLGYQVIEEHIRQGQRVAQQFNTRSYNLLSLWFNLMTSLTGNVDFSRQFARSTSNPSPPASNGTSPPKASSTEDATERGTAVSIEILSSCPTQVTFNLSPQAERLFLATPGLHTINADKPPLTDITFIPALENNPANLRIRIPDHQPPDLYSGVLIDRNTGLPQGTLSIRVLS
jgi:hypothetical protein